MTSLIYLSLSLNTFHIFFSVSLDGFEQLIFGAGDYVFIASIP